MAGLVSNRDTLRCVVAEVNQGFLKSWSKNDRLGRDLSLVPGARPSQLHQEWMKSPSWGCGKPEPLRKQYNRTELKLSQDGIFSFSGWTQTWRGLWGPNPGWHLSSVPNNKGRNASSLSMEGTPDVPSGGAEVPGRHLSWGLQVLLPHQPPPWPSLCLLQATQINKNQSRNASFHLTPGKKANYLTWATIRKQNISLGIATEADHPSEQKP